MEPIPFALLVAGPTASGKSALALALAGKVVGESLTDDARAKATIDRFIADLEAQAANGAGH